MSAYLVRDETINTILGWLLRVSQSPDAVQSRYVRARWLVKVFEEAGYDLTSKSDLERLGRDWYQMNIDALMARYGDADGAEASDYRYRAVYHYTPEGVYEEIRTLRYQASEGRVPETEMYRLLEEVYDALAHALVQSGQEARAEAIRNKPQVQTFSGSKDYVPEATPHKDVTEVAKIVRGLLKTHYGETKFSVRSERYAGGSSLRVEWTDGPTEKQVRDLTGFLASVTHIDQSDYANSARSEWEGEVFWSGANYISTSRHYSREHLESAAILASKEHDLPPLEVSESENGHAYFSRENSGELVNTPVHGPESYYGNAVYQKAHELPGLDTVLAEPEDEDSLGDDITVNEILEYEADNPVDFEPDEVTAAMQDPNKGGT